MLDFRFCRRFGFCITSSRLGLADYFFLILETWHNRQNWFQNNTDMTAPDKNGSKHKDGKCAFLGSA